MRKSRKQQEKNDSSHTVKPQYDLQVVSSGMMRARKQKDDIFELLKLKQKNKKQKSCQLRILDSKVLFRNVGEITVLPDNKKKINC